MSTLMTIIASLIIIMCVVVYILIKRDSFREDIAETLYVRFQNISQNDISEYINTTYAKQVIVFIILMLLFIIAM